MGAKAAGTERRGSDEMWTWMDPLTFRCAGRSGGDDWPRPARRQSAMRPGGVLAGARRRCVVIVAIAVSLAASCGGSSGSAAPATTKADGAATTAVRSSAASSVASGSTVKPSTSTTAAPTKSILELAHSEGSLSTLLRLLDTAGLTSLLNGSGPFSLLAPTDAAFAAMDKATFDKISADTLLLKSVLQYHVVPKRISTKDIKAGSVTTVEGSTVSLKATGQLPTVNGLTISRAARATNGTILVIESVLLPPDVKLA